MMHCTLAFLLLTTSRLQDSSLLALVNDYNQNSHYNVYGISHVKQFPVPRDGTNIFMTKPVYNGDGAYIATYCSESASGDEIVTEISHGLEAKFEDSRGSVGNHAKSVGRCTSSGGTACHQAINSDGDRGQIILSRTVADYVVSLAWVRDELKVFCRKQGQAQWLLLSDGVRNVSLGGLIHKVAWYSSGPFAPVKNLLDEHQNVGSHNREQFLGKIIKTLTLPKLTQTPENFKYVHEDNSVDEFMQKLFSPKQ